MKLPFYIVLAFVLLSYSECAKQAWLPSMMESFSNKTSVLTKYMRDKGQDLKHFYTHKVKNQFKTYFMSDNTTTTTTDSTSTAYDITMITNTKKVSNKHDSAEAISKYFSDTQLLQENVLKPLKRVYKCINDDPMVLMSTPQLIASNGYPSESHTIVTEDGYILTMHRIPHSKNSQKESSHKTALLHHGLLGSSADWVIPGPGKGLAYILSDAGYDVWLANVRGNTYSRAHISRSVESAAFWNFTFHEVSQYDLPAEIHHIMDVKGLDVKINYIGHSMGTTVLFALLSTKPQYNKILRAGYALAPVAYMSDIKSPLRLLAKFSNNIEYLMKLLGANEFLPQSTVLRWLSKYACEINHYEEVLCENSLFVFCGFDEAQFNRTLLSVILGHVPAGASTKTLVHYAQEIKNHGKFQQFDYGSTKNIEYYGSILPPLYPVDKITLPIALFSAENDWLAGPVDVTNLYVQLVNPIQHYIVPLKTFNHIDFLWAKDAPTLVYLKLLQLLQDGVSRPTAYFDMELRTGANKIANENTKDY